MRPGILIVWLAGVGAAGLAPERAASGVTEGLIGSWIHKGPAQ